MHLQLEQMFNMAKSREDRSMTPNVHQITPPDQTPFTADETRALEAVRFRFREDHDILSPRERAHLCFLRWLVRTGRVAR
jgi:hypothetical protein